jgi:hypothetical protein
MAAEPLPQESLDGRIKFVQLLLWGVIGLTASSMFPGLFADGSGSTTLVVIAAVCVLFALPFILALAMLGRPRLRYPALAIAASASSIAFVPLAILTAIYTPSARGWRQGLTCTVLVSLVVTLGLAAVLALRATRRFHRVERLPWRWTGAVAVTLVYATLTSLAFLGVQALPELPDTPDRFNVGADISTGDQAARRAIERIASCASAYAKGNPATGFPRTLEDLASGDRPCLDRRLAGGEADGFRYEYLPGLTEADGTTRVYMACAQPLAFPQSGLFTLVVNETGKVAHPIRPEDSRKTALSCREGWYFDFRNAIQYCALRYAAAHPDRGYPTSLREVGPRGDGCMVVQDWLAEPGEHSVAGFEERTTYVAGPAGSAGRITSFDVLVYPLYPKDPLAGAPSGAELERACLSGSGEACWKHGLAIAKDQTSPVPAAVAFRRGCDRAHGDSCLELAQLALPTDDAPDLLERACSNHSGRGCVALAKALEDRPDQSLRLEELLQLGCDAGEPTACTLLGERLMPSDPARATRLMVTGCAALRGTSCERYR